QRKRRLAVDVLQIAVAAHHIEASRVELGRGIKAPLEPGRMLPPIRCGLSVFRFDPATGAMSPVQQVQSANPSFVALHPSRRFLYVVNEIDDYEGRKSGSAEAYAIDPSTGTITLLNRQSLNSPIPAHLALDPTGRQLVVANYI